jgi:replicative DNA helicase
MGKTSLALNIALHASQTIPVLFVTFEHAPTNLLLKALCAQAGVNPQQVQRGYADIQRLRQANMAWTQRNFQLALIEGASTLTVSQIRTYAVQAMHRFEAKHCLVIVDYLQLWAKIAGEYAGMALARERVERLGGALHELARALRSPVIALFPKPRPGELWAWQRRCGA